MALSTLTISGKVLGKSQSLFTSWQMALPDRPLTLGELLTQIVRSEIAAFRDRQDRNRLTKVLGLVEIEAGVAAGKIASGGSELEQVVDEQGAIDNALQAFKDGFYLVFINDRQHEDLADLIDISTNSELLFLRLTPLVGG
jgi:DNA-directed RNA polymerase specialized sigma24 family protein